MREDMERLSDKGMKGKILFTGNGGRVIDDLIRLIPEEYQVEKCPVAEPIFQDALKNFSPHVVVVCLADETRETLRMFFALESMAEYRTMRMVAIGNEDDCDVIKRNVFLKNLHVFVRPLATELFLQALDQNLKERLEEIQKVQDELLEEEKRKEQEQKTAEILAQSQWAVAENAIAAKVEEMTQVPMEQTILVVDDDVRMLNVIKLYLQDMYNIVVVPSGKLALKYLAKKTADLILLDYMMPDEDGPTVLQKIRESASHAHVPVLFLTGVADKEMVMRGLEFRPNGYLLKPVTRETLLEKVTEILLGL